MGWDDDGWGDADFGEVNSKKHLGKNQSKDTKKDQQAAKNEKNKKDYFGNDGLDALEKDFAMDKNEDKFNKVLSTSKEHGGLMASLGIKNKDIANEDASLENEAEEAPHNKSDLFDTSKDRVAKKAGAKEQNKNKGKDSDEDFDLGFSSSKKQAAEREKDKKQGSDKKKSKNEGELTEAEQRKEIEE